MDKGKNELTVVTRAKDLCSYIMTVTQKCPKNFRYTYVSRLQNLAMDVIENIFRANDTFVSKGDARTYNIRLEFQHKALTDLKLLAYFSLLAMEQKCILPKQFEQISRMATDCQNLLGAWIVSDKRRFGF